MTNPGGTTTHDLLNALAIPPCARVDRRMPKTLLLEHGAPSAAERRRVIEGIQELRWIAALKPTTIGVPAFRDDTREYLEIEVLILTVRGDVPPRRIAEILHRAIPYPVLAIVETADRRYFSASHKRNSQAQANKVVLDGESIEVETPRHGELFATAFVNEIALDRQPRASMLALYQGWIDALLALTAARRTNRFAPLESEALRRARQLALRDCEVLDRVISRTRSAAANERQLARRVELNRELKHLESQYSRLLSQI